MGVSQFIHCLFGPRLFRIYRDVNVEGNLYHGTGLESYSDSVIKFITMTASVGLYSSPLVLSYLYRRGMSFSEWQSYSGFIRFAMFGAITFITAIVFRGFGRYSNNDYVRFVTILNDFKTKPLPEKRSLLRRYDFDFRSLPIDFRWNESALNDAKKPPQLLDSSSKTRRSSTIEKIKKIPCDFLSFLIIHSFGRRMIYPGSVWLFNAAVGSALSDGRRKLIEHYNGKRYKLLSRDGNEIDTLFVDKRLNADSDTKRTEAGHSSIGRNGKTLVICCEGNAGFYEIGTMGTPLEAGYSVIGWNHPGFGGSTGVPWPISEANAIDVVINFAVEKLGFKVNDIMIFAWSIGGFTASWAVMQYPDIKALILDASFDDIVPLAESKMPQSWKPLVRNTIRNYFNLNISAYLNYYNGPVLLIRRSRDEIISLNEQQSLRTNRGNDLLIKLLQNRFPKLINDDVKSLLLQYLGSDPQAQSNLTATFKVNDEHCMATLLSYADTFGNYYPLKIGDDMTNEQRIQLILYIASVHMKDYDSTHCTPLPVQYFQKPWNLFNEMSHPSKL